jgi:hypothetical protein
MVFLISQEMEEEDKRQGSQSQAKAIPASNGHSKDADKDKKQTLQQR